MKYNKIIAFIAAGLMLNACSDDLPSYNKNENEPEVMITPIIFNGVTRNIMDDTRDAWVSGRLTLPWMQYSAQVNYLQEDKYQYRTSTATRLWNNLYKTAINLKLITELATDEGTKYQMETYGNLDNQVAASRVMLSYIFLQLTDHFGDVPYWSYGNKDPEFQALDIESTITPKYVSQEKIYADILKELSEANDQFVVTDRLFSQGDNIYMGDASKWKKFANSLRLRVANRVKGKLSNAEAEMKDAVSDGVFESNEDNAIQHYGESSKDANPFWKAYFVDNRNDFGVNQQFVNLLKGESGNYGVDPRLRMMVAPKGVSLNAINNKEYKSSDDLNNYAGVPYGVPEVNFKVGEISSFSHEVLHANNPEVLMEYAEVEFLLSEMNGWDENHYKKGVEASMQKWGVSQNEIEDFLNKLPQANEKNVITQKYIALYMQPSEAWSEYRRTGFPNGDILLLPGGKAKDLAGATYTFEPLEQTTHIPWRISYPESEQTQNRENWLEATSKLENGDNINSKVWFMK